MGQQLVGQYPIHFHLAGDLDELGGYDPPTYVRDLSIHHTFSRCVTVHGSNGLLVSTFLPGRKDLEGPHPVPPRQLAPWGSGPVSAGRCLHLVTHSRVSVVEQSPPWVLE